MKVIDVTKLVGTDRDVSGVGFNSIRPILKKDGMGFSVHKTIIPKGGPYHWHYLNHLEACYCIEGKGVLKDLSNGKEFEIIPDMVYVLDNHDDHEFTATEDVILISIFNPPVTGQEVHNRDGSY